jgi:glycerate kinase
MRVLIAPDKFKGSLSATAVAGADYFLDLLGFHRHLRDVDLIITGEGRLDHQTLTGKLTAVVAHRSSPPPAAAVGRNDLHLLTSLFTDIHAVADHSEIDAAHDPQRTATCLQQIGTHIGKRLINLTDRPVGENADSAPTETAGSIRACREPHHVYPGALTFRRQTG